MGRDTKIDPALKALIDHVVAPELVRQYLDECRKVGDNGEGQSEIAEPYSTYSTVRRTHSAEDLFPSLGSGTSEEEPVQ